MSLRRVALAYLAVGLRPIPVRPDKRPLVRWGRYMGESPTVGEIEHWWHCWPEAQVAVLTGFGVAVLDVEAHAIDYLTDCGPVITPTAISQSSGRHQYFQPNGLRTTTLTRDGVHLGDMKATGGYVLAPPSVGTKGQYEWVQGLALGEVELAEAPEWLVEELGGGHTSKCVSPPTRTGTHGSRSEQDQADAYRMVADGHTDAEIMAVLASRESVQDRGRWGEDYVRRTVEKARDFAADNLAEAVIEKVQVLDGCARLSLCIHAGTHNAEWLRLPLDWPPTPRSARRWAALLAAVGATAGTEPAALVGARVCIEVAVRGGLRRVGRLYPARRAA